MELKFVYILSFILLASTASYFRYKVKIHKDAYKEAVFISMIPMLNSMVLLILIGVLLINTLDVVSWVIDKLDTQLTKGK